jgi:AcrR family transcriptional regulator
VSARSEPVTIARQRRTQDERSSAMRERLLDATIGCLVDYGYAGTTVTRIAERAGVTRGAQVHHYRTKNDLVTAAVTHLATKSAEVGWSQIARLADVADPVGRLLDILWEVHKGPTFTATVELWVAARTDADLRRHVATVEPVMLAILRDAADRSGAAGVIDDPGGADLLDAAFTAMDTMRGLMISAWHLPSRQRDARWRRARERLRAIFPSNDEVRSVITRATAAVAG